MLKPVNNSVLSARIVVGALTVASIALLAWFVFGDGLQTVVAVLAGTAQEENAHNPTFIGLYVCFCLLSLWLIVPSGSALLIVAGFVLGTSLATSIYAVLQILVCAPIYALADKSLHSDSVHHVLPPKWSGLLAKLKQEPISVSFALRLIPVIPNAAACALASTLDIPFKKFLLVTVLVCWVRPMVYASAGSGLQSITELNNLNGLISSIDLQPIFMFSGAIAIIIASKLWLSQKLNNKPTNE